ncbi:MAG: deoxyribodipyrimidine photo-lyase [Erysipelotrichaceae bacterium]
MKANVVFLQDNLRLHDNALFTQASSAALPFVALYVFDERTFPKHRISHPHTLQFRIEAIEDLAKTLHRVQIPLLVRYGKSETVLRQLPFEVDTLFCEMPTAFTQPIWWPSFLEQTTIPIQYTPPCTLYPEEMFAHLQEAPSFTDFLHLCEKRKVSPPLASCTTQKKFPIKLQEFDFKMNLAFFGCPPLHPVLGNFLPGGEEEAFTRMYHFLHHDQLLHYGKSIPNENCFIFSSKLSPYLAHGCLSVRLLYYEIIFSASRFQAQDACDLLIKRIMKREYAHLFATPCLPISSFMSTLQSTNEPMIDAILMELRNSGYLSYAMRTRLAAYCKEVLHASKEEVAAFFQERFLDFDLAVFVYNWDHAFAHKSTLPDQVYRDQDQNQPCLEQYIAFWLHGKPFF